MNIIYDVIDRRAISAMLAGLFISEARRSAPCIVFDRSITQARIKEEPDSQLITWLDEYDAIEDAVELEMIELRKDIELYLEVPGATIHIDDFEINEEAPSPSDIEDKCASIFWQHCTYYLEGSRDE